MFTYVSTIHKQVTVCLQHDRPAGAPLSAGGAAVPRRARALREPGDKHKHTNINTTTTTTTTTTTNNNNNTNNDYEHTNNTNDTKHTNNTNNNFLGCHPASRPSPSGARGSTHGSFLIRCQRVHPGVVLLLIIYTSANH